ncbi:hypothetical protein FHU41_002994 [Psychromicrobium silvestre]|uniref:DUF3046 domain-containing protein n=1 Tax=Psychromicrobium silvestre TaxID=1645614 RepID=A0A7Y9LW76_9MICC|nr:hypothetical protein [Psychromicrobium silvestre]
MSEFWRLMDDEFGVGYARSLAEDLVLAKVGGRSAKEALDAGVSPKAIWHAVCEIQGVPMARRLGKDVAPKA